MSSSSSSTERYDGAGRFSRRSFHGRESCRLAARLMYRESGRNQAPLRTRSFPKSNCISFVRPLPVPTPFWPPPPIDCLLNGRRARNGIHKTDDILSCTRRARIRPAATVRCRGGLFGEGLASHNNNNDDDNDGSYYIISIRDDTVPLCTYIHVYAGGMCGCFERIYATIVFGDTGKEGSVRGCAKSDGARKQRDRNTRLRSIVVRTL